MSGQSRFRSIQLKKKNMLFFLWSNKWRSPFCAGVYRQRERRAVPGLRRGAGEAPAPAHPARGGRAPHRSRLARLSRLSRSRTCRFTLRWQRQLSTRIYELRCANDLCLKYNVLVLLLCVTGISYLNDSKINLHQKYSYIIKPVITLMRIKQISSLKWQSQGHIHNICKKIDKMTWRWGFISVVKD